MFRVTCAAAIAFAAATSLVGGGPAQAKQALLTGLDTMHEQARVGGRTCMTEHEHGGEGTLPSKKGASEAAVRHWEGFTAWEYGKAWGSYRLAVGKQMNCRSGGAGWICKITARPCRFSGR